MVRRGRKAEGNVTLIDDNKANRAELLGSSKQDDDFSDLGVSLSSPSNGRAGTAMKSVDQMTVQELEDMALKEAMQGTEGTKRTLEKAREAKTIGVDTAEKLHNQTQQLEKMSEEIEMVHDYLDKGERLIEKMSRPKLVRMFRKGKKEGKGLDKVKGSKRQRAKRDELRKGGIAAVDLDGMKGADGDNGKVTMEEMERSELLGPSGGDGRGKRSLLGRRGAKEAPRTRVADIKEDYSQYSKGVAGAMMKQDEDLDGISAALGDMKGLAEAMNKELQYQEGMIEEVGDFTTETASRTKENVRRVNKLLK